MGKDNEGFDTSYVRSLVDNLTKSHNKQGEILDELRGIAIETKTMLQGQGEVQKGHGKKLEEHSVRIRGVERAHDICKADVEIRGLKRAVNHLLTFKDMIMSKADEDSKVIDVHAERMKAAVNAAMTQQVPYKMLLFKMLPWFIVIFVTGIALASIITFKALTGNAAEIPLLPKIEDAKTNTSSQGGPKNAAKGIKR